MCRFLAETSRLAKLAFHRILNCTAASRNPSRRFSSCFKQLDLDYYRCFAAKVSSVDVSRADPHVLWPPEETFPFGRSANANASAIRSETTSNGGTIAKESPIAVAITALSFFSGSVLWVFQCQPKVLIPHFVFWSVCDVRNFQSIHGFDVFFLAVSTSIVGKSIPARSPMYQSLCEFCFVSHTGLVRSCVLTQKSLLKSRNKRPINSSSSSLSGNTSFHSTWRRHGFFLSFF